MSSVLALTLAVSGGRHARPGGDEVPGEQDECRQHHFQRYIVQAGNDHALVYEGRGVENEAVAPEFRLTVCPENLKGNNEEFDGVYDQHREHREASVSDRAPECGARQSQEREKCRGNQFRKYIAPLNDGNAISGNFWRSPDKVIAHPLHQAVRTAYRERDDQSGPGSPPARWSRR